MTITTYHDQDCDGCNTLVMIQLYRRFPSILQVLTIIRPETFVRWHRADFDALTNASAADPCE